MEHVKIRMQIQKEAKGYYSNSLDCANKLLKQHGLSGFMKGTDSTMLREFMGCGAYFAVYF